MANKLKFIVIFIFFSTNIFGKIIFDKENIVITEKDLMIYKDSFGISNVDQNSNNKIIKEIYLMYKFLSRIKKENSIYLESIDNQINNNNSIYDNEFELEIARFSLIRNNLINDYFFNQFTADDLDKALKNLQEVKLSLSDTSCITINMIKKISEIKEFKNLYFNKLKDSNYKMIIIIDEKEYEICLDSSLANKIENEILNLIISKTNLDIKNFVYEK